MNLALSTGLNRQRNTVQSMETIGERLTWALDQRGMTAADLIRKTELSKGAVYNLLNDTTRNDKAWGDTIFRICRELRIDPEWLTYGIGNWERRSPQTDNGSDWSDITGYAQAVGLGEGAEASEYAETHKLKFRSDSLARKRLIPSKLAVMYGQGDSMLPRIRTGDAVLFDTSDTRPRDEVLFVILCPGVNGSEYSVKQCVEFGGDYFFQALNPEGDHGWRKPRRMDDKRHPIQIIGRVRWIGSWED